MSLSCIFARLSLTLALLLTGASAQNSPVGNHLQRQRAIEAYGKLPLAFETNLGQTDRQVKFLSRTNGYSLFLTGDKAVFALRGSKADTNKLKIARADYPLQSGMAEQKDGGVLRIKLRNANSAAKVIGWDALTGTSNYFIGNDPAKWRTDVPTYSKVKFEGIYAGIDLIYYGNQRQLEYDFIVAPGADPGRIAFDVSGAKQIRQDAHGDLVATSCDLLKNICFLTGSCPGFDPLGIKQLA
jgi:hypothetical protein